MKRETIIAFVGAIVDLAQVSRSEMPNFYFEAEEDLDGTYEVKFWNSSKKNTEFDTPNALVRSTRILTLTIDAATWNIPVGSCYYEVSKVENQRIFFKGDIEIIP
jgi:hypothetical protein